MCETSAPFRSGKWPGRRRCSSVAHEADEDVFERGLLGVEVLELDAQFIEPAQQAGNSGFTGLRVEGINQLITAGAEIERIAVEAVGHLVERRLQFKRQLLLAEFAHQRL